MLISLVVTLTQARTGVELGSYSLVKDPCEVNMFSLWQNTFFLWTFSISVINSAYSVSYFFKMITLISLIGTLTQTRMGMDRMTFYSYYRGPWGTDMSCLWQSSKIPRVCHKKDIMMGCYLQTKIRYGCSSPYVCVAVTEQRCSNDLRVLVCFNLIWLRHIQNYLYRYATLLHLFDFTFKIMSFLCKGHKFPTPPEDIVQRYHIFINNLCFQINNFWMVFLLCKIWIWQQLGGYHATLLS